MVIGVTRQNLAAECVENTSGTFRDMSGNLPTTRETQRNGVSARRSRNLAARRCGVKDSVYVYV